MAVVENNPLLEGLRGRVGNLIFKKYGKKTVVTKVPDMSRVKPNELQKLYKSVFSEAVAYAQAAERDPEKRAAFETILKPGQDVYHAALSHFLRKRKEEMANMKMPELVTQPNTQDLSPNS